VNGKSVTGIKAGTYARLSRQWKSGDKVRLKLDFSVQLAKDPAGSGYVAITRGPVVFALDQRLNKPMDKDSKRVVLANPSGEVKANEVKRGLPAGIQMALDVPFEVDGKRKLVRFCDYASAGQTWSAESELRVWMPQPLPMADQLMGTP